VSDTLLAAFPAEQIEKLQLIASESEEIIRAIFQQIQNNDEIEVAAILENVQQFADRAAEDASTLLAVVSTRLGHVSGVMVDDFAKRSTTLAMLGITTSVVMEQADEDTLETGLIGFLHDCSILKHPEWFAEEDGISGNSRMLADYRNHPLESAELLRGVNGVSERVLAGVAQVHEQFDGSGFPSGLSGNQLLASSRIINLADAYLNLVQPMFKKGSILWSDAIAYICYHASQRRFDPKIVRGFITGVSMYPIGSSVELDDESKAIVIRSNPTNPMEPSVQILGSVKRIADLSVSPRSIVGPDPTIANCATRITKSMMDDMLWRSDIGLEPAI
jgi:HD-GYP domain-containing protein (c-di-GMP phosphodiesterase class II)